MDNKSLNWQLVRDRTWWGAVLVRIFEAFRKEQMAMGRLMLTSTGAVALLATACGGECVETRIQYEATLQVGPSELVFSGFKKEREERDNWSYVESVADDASDAPEAVFTWGFGAGDEPSYGLFLSMQTPRADGETFEWDPSKDRNEQPFSVINGRENLGGNRDHRLASAASFEIVSASPLIIGLDVTLTPSATSSAVGDIHITGELPFTKVGNALLCGS